MNVSGTIELIKSELKPSFGCTEPAAIGLAVSRTCRLLEGRPEHIRLRIGSNIYKNAYSVRIPNTGKSGIALGAALGALLSDRENTMEIFGRATPELAEKAQRLAAEGFVEVTTFPDCGFRIEVFAENQSGCAETLTLGGHDRLVKAVVNGSVTLDLGEGASAGAGEDRSITHLCIRDLVEFCETVEEKELAFLEEAIQMNLAASNEGLQNSYGLQTGRSIRRLMEEGALSRDLANHVKMVVCAACDCRMGGGNVPVMTVLGSGNQGIQAILPVAAAAQYLGLPKEKLLRGVALSILITIFEKYQVGRLSPVCGAILSGAASSGAMAWLMGGGAAEVNGAVKNVLGALSGLVCDGAKDGCALKLRCCTEEAVCAAQSALSGNVIQRTDGIVGDDAEETVGNVALFSREGMAKADETVISIMLHKEQAR